jgi:hypothetical protein
MNRPDARKIAEIITNQQLQDMFDVAKSSITNWNVRSNVNKGMSKGAAWNILASNFDIEHHYHIMAITNMVREFGEFLPDELKPTKKKRILGDFIHQEPIFKKD